MIGVVGAVPLTLLLRPVGLATLPTAAEAEADDETEAEATVVLEAEAEEEDAEDAADPPLLLPIPSPPLAPAVSAPTPAVAEAAAGSVSAGRASVGRAAAGAAAGVSGLDLGSCVGIPSSEANIMSSPVTRTPLTLPPLTVIELSAGLKGEASAALALPQNSSSSSTDVGTSDAWLGKR